MIIIATILDIVWEFILSGVSLGLKAARLILLGTIMSVRYLRSHQEHHRVHGEPEPIDLDRWIRDWLPYGMSQHLTLILFGPFFGIALVYFHYTTFWHGLIVGAVISVVASLVEIQNYRQRIERERQKRMLRLFNVALAEFPIPSDQGFTWWISVRRWLTWPAQLRPNRQVRSRWPNDLGETFPGLIRFRLPPDYRPSREARDDFTEHLHDWSAMDRYMGHSTACRMGRDHSR